MTLLSEVWDTTRMRLLVEVDRQGSLSAAAQAVGIGQPSASQHLRTLETAAGQRLVERNGRGSRLTEGGRVLAAHAAQALAALAAGEQELGALAGLQTGTIRLGASTAPGSYLLPDTLGCFRRDLSRSRRRGRNRRERRDPPAPSLRPHRAGNRRRRPGRRADRTRAVPRRRDRGRREGGACGDGQGPTRPESARGADAALPRARLELAWICRARAAHDRGSASARLGAWLDRSREARRPRGPRRRLPFALRRRGGDRARQIGRAHV